VAGARDVLGAAQAGLRSRFDDFRRALDRRDGPAYRLALADFQDCLGRWTAAEEKVLVPALERAPLAGRDARRELTLEYVQLRELTRHVRLEIEAGARMSDILGLVENLARRFDAHEHGMLEVYYPAAAAGLTAPELAALAEAARGL
jgi:Hemerythrin HHE cation binding domain